MWSREQNESKSSLREQIRVKWNWKQNQRKSMKPKADSLEKSLNW